MGQAKIQVEEWIQQSDTNAVDTPFDVKFINAFVNAVTHVFEVQMNLPLQVKRALEVPPRSLAGYDVLSLVTLKSQRFYGEVFLGFEKNLIFQAFENLFEETVEEINEEIISTACEILNMTLGTAKIELNDKDGYGVQMAIPRTLEPEELKTHWLEPSALIVPLQAECGQFQIGFNQK